MAAHSYSSPLGWRSPKRAGERAGVLDGNKDSTSLPGLPCTLNPRPATGTLCQLGRAWQTWISPADQPVISRVGVSMNA